MSLLTCFFNVTATTEIYTLSLHDALPIWGWAGPDRSSSPPKSELKPPAHRTNRAGGFRHSRRHHPARASTDRKSTRLNSSHMSISYAVFCLKKKKKTTSTHKIRTYGTPGT